MNYRFVPEEKSTVPTIQEKFIDMYYEQDHTLDCVTKYHLACQSFTDQYNLKPPYSNYNSFTTMMNRRHRAK